MILIGSSIFIFTGCTYIDQLRDRFEQATEQAPDQYTISITDETGTSQSYQLDYIEGESLYESLNRASLINSEILVEFDVVEEGDDVLFVVSSLNGYNPSEDKKSWIYKVNGEKLDSPLTEVFINIDDQVSFEIE